MSDSSFVFNMSWDLLQIYLLEETIQPSDGDSCDWYTEINLAHNSSDKINTFEDSNSPRITKKQLLSVLLKCVCIFCLFI